MYRALYRKWRPKAFDDVIGQADITTALKNQILHGRIGHAYLFTGTRGTGKTTCARIFAKAINCQAQRQGEPCGECPVCRGIDEGGITDITEIDAASNNGVDSIRDLRDETVYTPSVCAYKVYIIDEVHMLSMAAFNALLKIMEEPPAHVIFILATTEIHKVPATIRSRCQRFDFSRISPDLIEARLAFVAREEGIDLAEEAAGLIARLADGAMRDALSILDTCAGVTNTVDEPLVRRMAGVTDKEYLFGISDAAAAHDVEKVLSIAAHLQERSVDVRRLCNELILHYRNLMLASLPDGQRLLTGVSAAEEKRYAQDAKKIPQRDMIRAIGQLCEAVDRMGKGTDARVEMELALFRLCEPEPQPAAPVAQAAQPCAAQPFSAASAGPQPFASAPVTAAVAASPPVAPQPPMPAVHTQPQAAPQQAGPAVAQPQAAAPAASPGALQPFPLWEQVVEKMESVCQPLYVLLRGSAAYCDGRRVLIDGSDFFLDYMRKNKDSNEQIRQVIAELSGTRYALGPYPRRAAPKTDRQAAEETLQRLEQQGVEVRYQNE